MASWMHELACHYETMRQKYPDDKLLIVFDIDGTILDMRYLVCYLLRRYDSVHGTRFFRNLRLEHLRFHENEIEPLLDALGVPEDQQEVIAAWYRQHLWSMPAILEAHRPYTGVLEVIRWFQIQPDTYVGLNTGRSELLRDETLLSLNELGREFRVAFPDDLLFMRPRGVADVREAKRLGIRYFRSRGFRVFAVVDNEPENLEAVAKEDPEREMLLLHAETLFQSRRESLPRGAVAGNHYDITELIQERALPRHIQFVWHGANDRANLEMFLSSRVHWAELDVRFDPTFSRLILRHDSFKERPLRGEEEWLDLEEALQLIKAAGKGVKLDLKAGGALLEATLELVKKHRFEDERLWFNGNIERLQETGFRRLLRAHPGAIRQCPIDFVAPLIVASPGKAREILNMLFTWGITRFSVSWLLPEARTVVERLTDWGFEVNIYNVPDLEGFLQAVLLLPNSITSDFNFPKWHYYGRGSGQNGRYHEYSSSMKSG